MKKNKISSWTKFVISADYLDFFLSAYYRKVIKNDHMGLDRDDRWKFIKEELAKSLKRKTYGKTHLHESEVKNESR